MANFPKSGLARAAACAAPALAMSILGACAAPHPFAYLDGARWSKVELNTFDTKIVSVDGKYYTYNSRIRIEPGRHHIVFRTVPAPGFREGPDVALDLDIAACTHYWFEAKKANAVGQAFEPRVNYTDTIVGCG